MGKKLLWFQLWSDQVLADRRIMELSWGAKGVFFIMLCMLRTQTDRPGYFINNGEIMSQLDINCALYTHYIPNKRGPNYTSKYVLEVLKSGLIKRLKDGTYYSRRIVEEVAESELKAKGGRVSWGRSVEQRAEQGVEQRAEQGVEQRVALEKRREENKRIKRVEHNSQKRRHPRGPNSVGSPPSRYENNPRPVWALEEAQNNS